MWLAGRIAANPMARHYWFDSPPKAALLGLVNYFSLGQLYGAYWNLGLVIILQQVTLQHHGLDPDRLCSVVLTTWISSARFDIISQMSHCTQQHPQYPAGTFKQLQDRVFLRSQADNFEGPLL